MSFTAVLQYRDARPGAAAGEAEAEEEEEEEEEETKTCLDTQ